MVEMENRIKPVSQVGMLDYLAGQIGCNYLSDLSGETYAGEIRYFILRNELNFSVKEWNDTVSYLLDQPCHFSSTEQAKAYLIAHLDKKKKAKT